MSYQARYRHVERERRLQRHTWRNLHKLGNMYVAFGGAARWRMQSLVLLRRGGSELDEAEELGDGAVDAFGVRRVGVNDVAVAEDDAAFVGG